MSDFFYYKILNKLPPLPNKFISKLPNSFNNDVLRDYPPRPYTIGDKTFDSVTQTHYQITHQPIIDWIGENITPNYNDIGFRHVDGSPARRVITPHTDKTRNYALIYTLETGGGELVFWKEKNKPILRTDRFNLHEYDNLTELDRVYVPEKSWYILNTMVIHSVENMSSPRIQLQLSLMDASDVLRFY
jgi:hypothetical protein